MKKGRITASRVRAAASLLPQYPLGSFDIVLHRLSDEWGFEVTKERLEEAFQRAGMVLPQELMAGAPCPTCGR